MHMYINMRNVHLCFIRGVMGQQVSDNTKVILGGRVTRAVNWIGVWTSLNGQFQCLIVVWIPKTTHKIELITITIYKIHVLFDIEELIMLHNFIIDIKTYV